MKISMGWTELLSPSVMWGQRTESGLLHEQKVLRAAPRTHTQVDCAQAVRAEAGAGNREGILWRPWCGNVGRGRWTWRDGASSEQGRGLTRFPRCCGSWILGSSLQDDRKHVSAVKAASLRWFLMAA